MSTNFRSPRRVRTAWTSQALGGVLPVYPNELPEAVLNSIYLMKHGRPVGWRFGSLVQVAHCVADKHPEFMRYLGRAVRTYGRQTQLESEDHPGKWKARTAVVRSRMEDRDPVYAADRTHRPLLRMLFPEVIPLESAPAHRVST